MAIMPRIPKLSNLLSTASGMALVIGTAVLVTVALAMGLAGPSRYAATATSATVRAMSTQPAAAPAQAADANRSRR
ncbi:MAG TPA: hypothetical protein VFN97_08180 [Actinospica sp.]|nr:hypothetical protein [Actinospica sp.]